LDKLRRFSSTLVLWAVVAAGLAVVLAAHEWVLTLIGHAAGLPADTPPGASRRPTPGELEAARRAWMRRKFGCDIHGPTPQQVADYHNRHHLGAFTPPDAVGPPE
jgi:hypothetical protein